MIDTFHASANEHKFCQVLGCCTSKNSDTTENHNIDITFHTFISLLDDFPDLKSQKEKSENYPNFLPFDSWFD